MYFIIYNTDCAMKDKILHCIYVIVLKRRCIPAVYIGVYYQVFGLKKPAYTAEKIF